MKIDRNRIVTEVLDAEIAVNPIAAYRKLNVMLLAYRYSVHDKAVGIAHPEINAVIWTIEAAPDEELVGRTFIDYLQDRFGAAPGTVAPLETQEQANLEALQRLIQHASGQPVSLNNAREITEISAVLRGSSTPGNTVEEYAVQGGIVILLATAVSQKLDQVFKTGDSIVRSAGQDRALQSLAGETNAITRLVHEAVAKR